MKPTAVCAVCGAHLGTNANLDAVDNGTDTWDFRLSCQSNDAAHTKRLGRTMPISTPKELAFAIAHFSTKIWADPYEIEFALRPWLAERIWK